jgi:hypothetical protein
LDSYGAFGGDRGAMAAEIVRGQLTVRPSCQPIPVIRVLRRLFAEDHDTERPFDIITVDNRPPAVDKPPP